MFNFSRICAQMSLLLTLILVGSNESYGAWWAPEWLSRYWEQKQKTSKNVSIDAFLAERLDIDWESVGLEELSQEEYRQLLRRFIREAIGSDEVVYSLVNGIALRAMESDSLKIKVKQIGGYAAGLYLVGSDLVKIAPNGDRLSFVGTLVHEWGHQMMDVLYRNNCNPYGFLDWNRSGVYQEAITQLEANLDGIAWGESVQLDAVKSRFDLSSYHKRSYNCEYVVRLPQVMASGYYKDERVKEVLKPLKDYWDKYIQPDIDKYIKDRSASNLFVCDWRVEGPESHADSFMLLAEDYELDRKVMQEYNGWNSHHYALAYARKWNVRLSKAIASEFLLEGAWRQLRNAYGDQWKSILEHVYLEYGHSKVTEMANFVVGRRQYKEKEVSDFLYTKMGDDKAIRDFVLEMDKRILQGKGYFDVDIYRKWGDSCEGVELLKIGIEKFPSRYGFRLIVEAIEKYGSHEAHKEFALEVERMMDLQINSHFIGSDIVKKWLDRGDTETALVLMKKAYTDGAGSEICIELFDVLKEKLSSVELDKLYSEYFLSILEQKPGVYALNYNAVISLAEGLGFDYYYKELFKIRAERSIYDRRERSWNDKIKGFEWKALGDFKEPGSVVDMLLSRVKVEPEEVEASGLGLDGYRAKSRAELNSLLKEDRALMYLLALECIHDKDLVILLTGKEKLVDVIVERVRLMFFTKDYIDWVQRSSYHLAWEKWVEELEAKIQGRIGKLKHLDSFICDWAEEGIESYPDLFEVEARELTVDRGIVGHDSSNGLEIARKWYERGQRSVAYDFLNKYLEGNPGRVYEVEQVKAEWKDRESLGLWGRLYKAIVG